MKVLTVNFGQINELNPRMYVKEMGGGVLLDMGCYNVMFTNLIFGREKPRKIVASATLTDSGRLANSTFLWISCK